MTCDELLATVTVHCSRTGMPEFAVHDGIPQPCRDQFWVALRGSCCPVVMGVDRCAYVWDWQDWAQGTFPR
jgi:hypothetical protein